MSMEQFVIEPRIVPLGAKAGSAQAVVDEITFRQLLVAIAVFEQVRADLGIERADLDSLTKEGGAGAAGRVLQRLVAACGKFADPETMQVTGPGLTVLKFLANVFQVTPDDLLDAGASRIYALGVATWEVNAGGPLGEKLAGIIASFQPILKLLKSVLMMTFQQELMKALPPGGIPDGGTIESSPPLSNEPAGPNGRSLIDSPPAASSPTLPASDTLPASKRRRSAAPAKDAAPAEAADRTGDS